MSADEGFAWGFYNRVVEDVFAEAYALADQIAKGPGIAHDGEYRWLRTVSRPRFGADGDLIGFIGVGSDITLAKEAELELRRQVEERTAQLAASEAQFRAVFEAALEVMLIIFTKPTSEMDRQRTLDWIHSIDNQLTHLAGFRVRASVNQ